MKKKILFSIALCAFLTVLLFFLKPFFLPDNTRLCYHCKNFTELKMNNNKEVPPELINSFVFAQSYFPELDEVFISVQFTSISSTMLAQPEISFKNFFSKERKYIIYINKDFEKFNTVDILKMSNEIQIGWISHELSHIVDYENRNIISLIGLGFYYSISKSFRRKVENYADETTIYRGLGKELLSGVIYSTSHPSISSDYKKKLIENYYSPDELISIIDYYNMICHKKNIKIKRKIIPCHMDY